MATLDKSTARYERAATREHLERKVKEWTRKLDDGLGGAATILSIYLIELEWVRSRQQRYDKKKGGL